MSMKLEVDCSAVVGRRRCCAVEVELGRSSCLVVEVVEVAVGLDRRIGEIGVVVGSRSRSVGSLCGCSRYILLLDFVPGLKRHMRPAAAVAAAVVLHNLAVTGEIVCRMFRTVSDCPAEVAGVVVCCSSPRSSPPSLLTVAVKIADLLSSLDGPN